MSIKTLSVKQYGKNYKISDHFTLGEFQCRDGSDTVKYSTELLAMLERLRSYGNFTISINSGYRTPAYNKKNGGASKSKHTEGYAADVVVKRDGKTVNAKLVCCLCQTLGFKGIGYISSNATHLDMRPSGTYRGDERGGYAGNVNNDFYKYFNIGKAVIDGLKAPEEDEMTQEQFNAMMENYLASRAKQNPSDWSLADRQWAEQSGIIKDGHYKSFCTREEMVAMLHRLPQSGGKITDTEVARAMEAIAKEYKGE